MNKAISEFMDIAVTEGQGQDGSDVASSFCGHKVYVETREDLSSS